MADGSLVTLVVVVIDTAGEMLRWCSAGHPPPVVVSADGAYRTLEDPDPPCGIFPGQRFHAGMARFAPGDMLFTYTDGLIEARRRGEEFGERRLREAVLEVAGERPDHVARAVYATARTWSEGRLTDDVAIAVVKRVPVRLLAA
jgi:serine phosphatase RsbU (regulator of sigma subunit)